MKASNDNTVKPQDIIKKTITRSCEINNQKCDFVIKDALFTQIDNKEILLDEIVVNNMVTEMINVLKGNHTKYNTIPKSVIISHKNEGQIKDDDSKSDDFLYCYKPQWTIDDVYLDEGSKKQIITSLTMIKHKEKLFNEWGLKSSVKSGRSVVLNFFGSPGTGKSMMAEAVADYLNKDIFSVNYAELESKYVGETPKNIKKAFERAKEGNAVLVFDEADSFLGKRLTNVSQSADYGVNITRSVMFLEIEKFDGVVVFTTNLIKNYDEAFKRRILANVEFRLPDEKGREVIWDKHIPKRLPLEHSITPANLASKYDGISGADIKDIVLYAAVICLERKGEFLTIEDFDRAHQYITSRYSRGEELTIHHEVISNEQYEDELRQVKSGEEL